MRQSHDTATLLFADDATILLALLLILLLSGVQGPQFVIPVGLERIGDQAVGRVDVQVASLREIGLIPSTLHLLLAQMVHLLPSGLNLLLDLERDFQREGSDRVEQKLADRLVDLLPQEPLADLNDMVGAGALTHILRSELGLALVVTDGHAVATDPTHS